MTRQPKTFLFSAAQVRAYLETIAAMPVDQALKIMQGKPWPHIRYIRYIRYILQCWQRPRRR